MRRRTHVALFAGLCVALVLSAVSCAQLPGRGRNNLAAPAAWDSRYLPTTYLLAPGDVIDVRFYYNEELDDTLPVRPDGMITLQLVGDVRAAGIGPADLRIYLEKAYKAHLPHPKVAVVVKEYTPQQVFIGGEVQSPGTVRVHGALTATQAIMDRGGSKVTASLRHVVLIRYDGPGAKSVYEIDLKSVMKGEVADTLLRPYDILYVPQSPIAKLGVFVDLYINEIVPKSISFPFFYQFAPSF